MRVLVGKVVDVEKPVNLVTLSRVDRVLYSAIDGFRKMQFYRRRIAKTQEREEEEKRQLREHLTDGLLSIIYNQITMNTLLDTKNDKCCAVLVEIPHKYVAFIDDVLATTDFIAYDVTHIKPSKDAQKYSRKLPHMVKITQKREVAGNEI